LPRYPLANEILIDVQASAHSAAELIELSDAILSPILAPA
jgi:hypothetical protein